MRQEGGDATIDNARELFSVEGLPFPPLPDNLGARLRPFGEYVFTTRELDYGPYAMQPMVAEARESVPVSDYAVVGFDGHGVNSWAVHHFLVRGPLALFMQFAWGGAYMDAELGRRLIDDGFAFSQSLQDTVWRAEREGRMPVGRRLVVSVTDIGESGWGWIRPREEAEWHDGAAYEEIDAAVRTLLSGAS